MNPPGMPPNDVQAAPGVPATPGPVVHVIDDHALVRKHLCTVLSFHGYRVVPSADGAQAHAALLEQPPDVVLMDLQMPGEDGYALLRWMRTQVPLATVPVICVTASLPASEHAQVQAAGFAQLLSKPVSPPRVLLDAVARALEKRRDHATLHQQRAPAQHGGHDNAAHDEQPHQPHQPRHPPCPHPDR